VFSPGSFVPLAAFAVFTGGEYFDQWKSLQSEETHQTNALLTPLVLVVCFCLGRWITMALANLFLLCTFRHGTGFASWIRIHFHGGDPSYGGSPTGSTASSGFRDVTENKFFVFADSPWNLLMKEQHHWINRAIAKRTLPFQHKYYVLREEIKANAVYSPTKTEKGQTIFHAHLSALLLPTIRFHIPPRITVAYYKFKLDPRYQPWALSTSKLIPASNIGIIGVLKNSRGCWKRLWNWEIGPANLAAKLLTGAVQMLGVFLLGCTVWNFRCPLMYVALAVGMLV